MKKSLDWSKYFEFDQEKIDIVLKIFEAKKIFGMGLMPVRGPKGFRKLDYEFAEKQLDVKEVMNKMEECHFNIFGLVIKDTDGACTWNTDAGWNPTGRDILGEFCDAAIDRNIKIIRIAAILTMAGIIINRCNYVFIAYKWYVPLSERYIPSWQEVIMALTIVFAHIWVFRWIVHRMAVYRKPPAWTIKEDRHAG